MNPLLLATWVTAETAMLAAWAATDWLLLVGGIVTIVGGQIVVIIKTVKIRSLVDGHLSHMGNRIDQLTNTLTNADVAIPLAPKDTPHE